MKSNKIFFMYLLCMCAVSMAFANIGVNENEPSCDNTTIGATSGDANMEAIWGANTINLVYSADSEIFTPSNEGAGTCTYDAKVTIPTNVPTKTGYTFDGWRVIPPFDLSSLASRININSDVYGYTGLSNVKAYDYNAATYGLTTGSGTWAVEFQYGAVKGVSRCNTIPGNTNGLWSNGYVILDGNIQSNIADETGQAGAQYCWCSATEYKPDGGVWRNVDSSSWVYRADCSSQTECIRSCAKHCANVLRAYSGFRRAIYGILN